MSKDFLLTIDRDKYMICSLKLEKDHCYQFATSLSPKTKILGTKGNVCLYVHNSFFITSWTLHVGTLNRDVVAMTTYGYRPVCCPTKRCLLRFLFQLLDIHDLFQFQVIQYSQVTTEYLVPFC